MGWPPRFSARPQTFVFAQRDKSIKIGFVLEALDRASVILWREQGKMRRGAAVWLVFNPRLRSRRAFATLRQLSDGRLAHWISVLRAGERSGPHLLSISFDGLLDGWS